MSSVPSPSFSPPRVAPPLLSHTLSGPTIRYDDAIIARHDPFPSTLSFYEAAVGSEHSATLVVTHEEALTAAAKGDHARAACLLR